MNISALEVKGKDKDKQKNVTIAAKCVATTFVLLDDAASALSRGDTSTVKRALTTLLDALNNHHGAGRPVSVNAYWLLKVNVEYLIAHTS